MLKIKYDRINNHNIKNDVIIKNSLLYIEPIQALIAQKNDINAYVLIHQKDTLLGEDIRVGLILIHLSIQISAHNHIDNKSCKTISTFIA